MATAPKTNWTIESYLAFERASDEKHEFVDGEIYLMAGASPHHNIITANTIAALHPQLRQKGCIIYASDQRVRFGTQDYTYPDVTVVCGTPQFDDSHQDTLLNPILIIEVLSPSTESYDRGKKFQKYRELESLQEYVLIAQESPRIERYLRQADGQWLLADAAGLDAVLELAAIGGTLSLTDVYENVNFNVE